MKKQIKLLLLLMIIIGITTLNIMAEKLTDLEELGNPRMLLMENGRIYIADGASVCIYSSKDYKLIKKFGKRGEGPGEFMVNPTGPGMLIYPFEKGLYVNSDIKLSIFSRDGEFQREQKATPFTVFMPVSDRFIASGFFNGENRRRFLTVNLHDKDLKVIKQLYVSDRTIGNYAFENLPGSAFNMQCYQDKIYVIAAKSGFAINVYDKNGKLLKQIKKDEKPLKVTDEYRSKTMFWFKNISPYKRVIDRINITYRKYFPLIQDLFVADNRIYVFTYKIQNEKTECIVMDLEGKIIQRIFLPRSFTYPLEFSNPSCFRKNVYYVLVDNLDTEIWELHSTPVR